jgi:hypothetical protein
VAPQTARDVTKINGKSNLVSNQFCNHCISDCLSRKTRSIVFSSGQMAPQTGYDGAIRYSVHRYLLIFTSCLPITLTCSEVSSDFGRFPLSAWRCWTFKRTAFADLSWHGLAERMRWVHGWVRVYSECTITRPLVLITKDTISLCVTDWPLRSPKTVKETSPQVTSGVYELSGYYTLTPSSFFHWNRIMICHRSWHVPGMSSVTVRDKFLACLCCHACCAIKCVLG